MTNKNSGQEHVFQALKGDPAGINTLAANYEKVATHLKTSKKRLHDASADLKNLKGKNFDALDKNVVEMTQQYTNLIAHFERLAEELRTYSKQLKLAQSAAETARSSYTQAISSLNEAFSSNPTPAPAELLHPSTYPDTVVNTAGWPIAAHPAAQALNAARHQWHQALAQKTRAGNAAEEKIDASALLQSIAGLNDSTKKSKVADLATAAGVAGGTVAAVAGTKAARRATARKDYQAAAANIRKESAARREKLTATLNSAKASGNATAAARAQARIDLLNDREKFQLEKAKQTRDDRLDKINGKVDAKQEKSEARADAQEQKELQGREYQIDKQAAQENLEKAQASGDPDAVARAQAHVQLVEDRHTVQNQLTEQHLQSHLAHIELAQHPGKDTAAAAHQLLQSDKALANAEHSAKVQLADRSFRLNSADTQAKIAAAQSSGDTALVDQLKQHQQELQQAHTERLADLKHDETTRVANLQKAYESAHPAAAHGVAGATAGEAHLAVGHVKAGEGTLHAAHGVSEELKAVKPAAHGLKDEITDLKPVQHGKEHLAATHVKAGEGRFVEAASGKAEFEEFKPAEQSISEALRIDEAD